MIPNFLSSETTKGIYVADVHLESSLQFAGDADLVILCCALQIQINKQF